MLCAVTVIVVGCIFDTLTIIAAFFSEQHTITSIHWDPTGQILATTATEPEVRVWYPGDGQWECLYGLKHSQPVNITAWCTMTGKGEVPLLMLARSVHCRLSGVTLIVYCLDSEELIVVCIANDY